MTDDTHSLAIVAAEAPPRAKPSNYPPLLAERVKGRTKRVLGDLFGLKNFGVNLTTVAPGSCSALLHRHTRQDEFVYVLEGELELLIDGQPPMKIKAGESYQIPEGAVHDAKAGDKPFKVLGVYVVKAGEPLAKPSIGDVAAKTVPKMSLLSPPVNGGRSGTDATRNPAM